jgi:hypothetical protein
MSLQRRTMYLHRLWRWFTGFLSRSIFGYLFYVIYSVYLQVVSHGAQGLVRTVLRGLCLVWTGTTVSWC